MSAGRILVINSDRATFGLLKEWLQAEGYEVAQADAAGAKQEHCAALAIVDIPFTRSRADELLQLVSEQHPGTPILALSATFFSNVKCGGDCARALGVAGVLPKPATRDALLAGVSQVLRRPG